MNPLGEFGRFGATRLILPGLIVVLIAFGPPPLLMGYWFLRDIQMGEAGDVLAGSLLILGWLLFIGLMVFYVALAPLRVQLFQEGVCVLTWRGWRLFEWKDVRAAKVSSHKGMTATLVLNLGALRRVRICLNDYQRRRSLFEAIRDRLPVPVAVFDFQWAIIRDMET